MISFILSILFSFQSLADSSVCIYDNPFGNLNLELFKNLERSISSTFQTHKSFECPSWIKERNNLPPCPNLHFNKTATIPETYPKAIIFLGDSTNPDSIVGMLEQAYKSNPKQVPIFAGYFLDSLPLKLSELFSKYPDFPWQNHLISVPNPFGDYIRDKFTSRVLKNGNIEILPTSYEFSGGIPAETSALLQNCGIQTSDDIIPKHEYNQKTLGGNFLTFLPGINISTSLTSIHRRSGWTEKNTITFPSLTNVQHIDEILQPVKTQFDENGCPQISALVASPNKAKELLKIAAQENPDEYFFDLPIHRQSNEGHAGYLTQAESEQFKDKVYSKPLNARTVFKLNEGYKATNPTMDSNGKYTFIPFKSASDFPSDAKGFDGGIKEVIGFQGICKAYESLPTTEKSQLDFNKNELYDVTFIYGEKPSNTLYLNATNENKTTKIKLEAGYSEQEYNKQLQLCNAKPYCKINFKAKTSIDPKYCENLTVKDMYQVLEHTDYNKKEAEEFEENIAKLKLEIDDKIKKEYPKCNVKIDWISSPVIKKNKSWALPNSTNSLPINDQSVGIPEPYSATFKRYFEKELNERKLNVNWVDTLGLNNGVDASWANDPNNLTGNLHCSSNSVPICSPK